jgi:hypothetical protein
MVALATGCGGPRTGEVSGTVTLDGVPAAGLIVRFDPETAGAGDVRPSCGFTGTDGRYRLMQTGQSTGVVAGPHRVSVVSGDGAPLRNGAATVAGAESRHDVKAGENVIRLDLRSNVPDGTK